MCGIAGIWRREGPGVAETAARMADRIAHRGPDDSGVWSDAVAGVALSFRRLAIIDVSPAGHQPMQSVTGRYTIVFNGEVYNFAEIRQELERAGLAPQWRGHSDTEVILAGFEAWGLDETVKRFVGMFGFAVWDARERRLHLVRDRMGVKPLYYSNSARAVLFGSELKAMRAAEECPRAISRDALGLYVQFAYVPAPYTIYEGAWKVPPGTIVTFDADGTQSVREYWSLRDVITNAKANRFSGTDQEAIEEVERVAMESVRLRMVADVPLGVFLSGGIDSSLVTALMQAQSSVPVKTFSIGFLEAQYDEAHYAAAVARHLGTEHTELYVTAEDARAVIPLLADMYDEPFADSSQIPTYLVSKLAREHVTVSLSGDGGDEFFAGYHRYFLGKRFWDKVERLPRFSRPIVAAAMRSVPMETWNTLLSPSRRFVPRWLRRERGGERIHRLARAMDAPDADALYREVVTQWPSVIKGARELPIAITERDRWPALPEVIDRMMYFDQVSYLPDDILAKVDRASMAVSLEAREPLLDHRLIELAWRLPLSMKLRDGGGKWILKKLLSRYVPEAFTDRPKMGFGLPLDSWLRGPLRDWAESLLNERRLREEDFFDAAVVREKWTEHLTGRGEWQSYLWTVLMFQAWLDRWKSDATATTHDVAPAAGLLSSAR